MVAPSGVCGVHCVPKAGQSVRLLQPLEHLAADADLGLARADVLHLEDAVGIVIAEFVR